MIKELALQQKALKKDRKTGTYEVTWETGYAWNHKVPDNISKAWKAANEVQRNKLTITAALNLYHELRGSEYRHNYESFWKHVYDAEMVRIKSELIRITVSK